MIPLQRTTSDNCWIIWLLHPSKHLNQDQVPQRVEHLMMAQAPLRPDQVAYAVDVNQSGRCNFRVHYKDTKTFLRIAARLVENRGVSGIKRYAVVCSCFSKTGTSAL